MEQLPPSNPTPSNQSPQEPNNVELWGRLRLALLIVGVLVVTAVGRACKNKAPSVDKVPGQSVSIKPQGAKVSVVGAKKVKVQTPYVPPEGSITITPKDPTKSLDDLVKIHYQEMGWTFKPGIECSGNLYFACGLDAKIFFAYRFGVGAGVVAGTNVNTIISPDLFISYRLDRLHLPNTEAICTYVPIAKIPFGLGLRINF